jgi:hypothetical protein
LDRTQLAQQKVQLWTVVNTTMTSVSIKGRLFIDQLNIYHALKMKSVHKQDLKNMVINFASADENSIWSKYLISMVVVAARSSESTRLHSATFQEDIFNLRCSWHSCRYLPLEAILASLRV